ncbi:unnamed protein product [Leptidea sinapis]|uniref:Uncharacterized protein n=1 Tax=Leptidea sinapis TaxID=189913 RepID=A0A5E4Q1S5_9NEOP|nr:unnamed protein product [Leptidea sinapis]
MILYQVILLIVCTCQTLSSYVYPHPRPYNYGQKNAPVPTHWPNHPPDYTYPNKPAKASYVLAKPLPTPTEELKPIPKPLPEIPKPLSEIPKLEATRPGTVDSNVLNNLAIALQLLIVSNIINNAPHEPLPSKQCGTPMQNYLETVSPNAKYLGEYDVLSNALPNYGFEKTLPLRTGGLMSPYEAINTNNFPEVPFMKDDFQNPYAAVMAFDGNKDVFSVVQSQRCGNPPPVVNQLLSSSSKATSQVISAPGSPSVTTIVDNSLSNTLANALQLLIVGDILEALPSSLKRGLINEQIQEIITPRGNIEVIQQHTEEISPNYYGGITETIYSPVIERLSPNMHGIISESFSTQYNPVIETISPNGFGGLTESFSPFYNGVENIPHNCYGYTESILPNYREVTEVVTNGPYFNSFTEIISPTIENSLGAVNTPSAFIPNFYGGLTELVSAPVGAEVLFPSEIPAQLKCNFGYTSNKAPCKSPYNLATSYATVTVAEKLSPCVKCQERDIQLILPPKPVELPYGVGYSRAAISTVVDAYNERFLIAGYATEANVPVTNGASTKLAAPLFPDWNPLLKSIIL